MEQNQVYGEVVKLFHKLDLGGRPERSEESLTSDDFVQIATQNKINYFLQSLFLLQKNPPKWGIMS